MSRSKRKPYVKDKGLATQEYWSSIRRSWKQHLKKNYLDPDLNFASPKSIINDWTYCDYRWEIYVDKITKRDPLKRFGYSEEDVKRYSRK